MTNQFERLSDPTRKSGVLQERTWRQILSDVVKQVAHTCKLVVSELLPLFRDEHIYVAPSLIDAD